MLTIWMSPPDDLAWPAWQRWLNGQEHFVADGNCALNNGPMAGHFMDWVARRRVNCY